MRKRPPRPPKIARTETLVPIRVHKRIMRHLEQALAAANREADNRKAQLTRAQAEHEILVQALRHDLNCAQHHPHRLEEQVKTWVLALNRLGIGVRLIAEWVLFRRGGIDVRLHWNDLIVVGIPAIIKMFDPIRPSSFDPQNNIDGVEGWRHPDDLKNDRDLALEKANRSLHSVGLRVATTESVPNPKDDDAF